MVFRSLPELGGQHLGIFLAPRAGKRWVPYCRPYLLSLGILKRGAVHPRCILPGMQAVTWPLCCGPGVMVGGDRHGVGTQPGPQRSEPKGSLCAASSFSGEDCTRAESA